MTDSLSDLTKKIQKLDALNLSFDYVKLNVASPEQAKKWAERQVPGGEFVGELLNSDTLNYRNLSPEAGGLFCQKIFGPVNSWKCACGKYRGTLVDKICEDCKVELIESRVRRYRMGYINLTYPVSHPWYTKGTTNYLTLLLTRDPEKKEDFIKKKHIDEILYFAYQDENIPESNPLYKYSIIHENLQFSPYETLYSLQEKLRRKLRRGTELLIKAFNDIDLEFEVSYSRAVIRFEGRQSSTLRIRRLRILENFLASNTKLSSIIISILAVLPPNLRPLVEIADSRLVSADANEFYRLIVMRSIRLNDAYEVAMPDFITSHSKTLLQEGVDQLIDNAKLPQGKILCLNDRPLKSLTETLEGKEGRFRQNLLGKRVDYSARSVIVVGPGLRLNQCGLPYDIVSRLFEIHLINILLKTKVKGSYPNYKLARFVVKKRKRFIWTLLEKLLENNCILLNRAPTLHKFGIQAFNPVLILGQAIQLHPLVCTGFNADFDGDQMAVHLPLYEASQFESQTLMSPSNNILSPANGDVILKPTQDMVIGSYYLSMMIKKKAKDIFQYFASEEEAVNAFYTKKLELHENIFVRYKLNNQLKIEMNEANLFQDLQSLNTQKINQSRIFYCKKNYDKIYILTNLGIIVGHLLQKDFYVLKELYLETTLGRLIFTNNIKKVFAKIDI